MNNKKQLEVYINQKNLGTVAETKDLPVGQDQK